MNFAQSTGVQRKWGKDWVMLLNLLALLSQWMQFFWKADTWSHLSKDRSAPLSLCLLPKFKHTTFHKMFPYQVTRWPWVIPRIKSTYLYPRDLYLCSGIQLQLIKETEIFNQLNCCASIGIFFLKWKFEKLLYLMLVTQCSLKELGEICTVLWVCGAAIVVSQSQAGWWDL